MGNACVGSENHTVNSEQAVLGQRLVNVLLASRVNIYACIRAEGKYLEHMLL